MRIKNTTASIFLLLLCTSETSCGTNSGNARLSFSSYIPALTFTCGLGYTFFAHVRHWWNTTPWDSENPDTVFADKETVEQYYTAASEVSKPSKSADDTGTFILKTAEKLHLVKVSQQAYMKKQKDIFDKSRPYAYGLTAIGATLWIGSTLFGKYKSTSK